MLGKNRILTKKVRLLLISNLDLKKSRERDTALRVTSGVAHRIILFFFGEFFTIGTLGPIEKNQAIRFYTVTATILFRIKTYLF